VTPAQVRLAWTLQQGPHVLAIPGTGSPDHLLENVAAASLRLSADDLEVGPAPQRQAVADVQGPAEEARIRHPLRRTPRARP
jgi:aryl-alcohol dehydrogenase-like predicted oxidoreductase